MKQITLIVSDAEYKALKFSTTILSHLSYSFFHIRLIMFVKKLLKERRCHVEELP